MKENMFKKSILIVLLSCLAVSCTTIRLPVQKTPLQKELASGVIPRFDGYVSPITIPIRPMYKPAVSDVKQGIARVFSTIEKGTTENKELYIGTTLKQKIQKAGDMLVWDITFDDVTADGKTTPVELGIRMLSDSYGKAREVEVIGLALDISDRKSQEELAGLIKKYSVGLSGVPIRSGDPIAQIKSAEIFSEISDLFWDDFPSDISIEFSSDFSTDSESPYITKGWSFFNGRKVVVATINDTLTRDGVLTEDGNVISETVKFDTKLKLNGYALFDAETFQMVDNKVLSVFELSLFEEKFDGNFALLSIKTLRHRTEF